MAIGQINLNDDNRSGDIDLTPVVGNGGSFSKIEINFNGILGSGGEITLYRVITIDNVENEIPVAKSWLDLAPIVIDSIPIGGLTLIDLSPEQKLRFKLDGVSTGNDAQILLLGFGVDFVINPVG